MTNRERRILDAAVLAFQRSTGIEAGVHRTKGKVDAADAVLDVKTGHRTRRFAAEVKAADRFVTPAMLKAKDKASGEPPLLVAPYITRQIAERCRQLRLPFIDTAGNAYLEAAGLFIYVVGHTRPVTLRRENYPALNPAGLKLTFALLCRPELLDQNYRNIALEAGVALGTVSSDMKDLEARGFFDLGTHPHVRKLLDPERMLEEWVTHYPVTLRPKLRLGRFLADPERLRQTNLALHKAYWGGEPAAGKLTRYLKPAQYTIYTREPIAKLVAAGRMRADERGNVEILEKFWNFDRNGDMPDVVPPVLAYADLLATHESRNAEAARMIHEQRIAPAFRTPN